MPFIADSAFDNGLSYLDTNGTRMDICSAEPTTYAQATSTLSLGDAVVNTGAPQAGDVDGRKVVVPAISGATVDTTGTASHWALTDGTSELLATGALASSQPVTAGNTWDLTATDITFRDAT